MADSCNRNPAALCSSAQGSNTVADGVSSTAQGYQTRTNNSFAHSEGSNTTAGNGRSGGGAASHAEGHLAVTGADTAHAQGYATIASGDAAHAQGYLTAATGASSHAQGARTRAEGISAHAEGEGNTASGRASHAEGGAFDLARNLAPTRASGESSHAEGIGTIASGFGSHAQGGTNDITFSPGPRALNSFSHAQGLSTISRGIASHAQGALTDARGDLAHAEGYLNIASGIASHAEGLSTVADGDYSHSEGSNTRTSSFAGAHIMGRNGDAIEAHSWFIANGPDEETRGIGAQWLASTGDMSVQGRFIPGGQDYAELFESVNGVAIDVGYFVTLVDEKIRIATDQDDYILGVTSATPGIIGNGENLRWKDQFMKDEWGRVLKEEVVIPAKYDASGMLIQREEVRMQPVLNPDWDPSQAYVPRIQRTEWSAVGMIGILRVRDDGTSRVNGFCRPNGEGMATDSEQGYRVIKRTGPNQIVIILK
ncbi:hypothetical protein M1I95_21470 [Rossellomorea marisflavi]|uniref:peptidase G2 autoproteolytic cleavage domain-containing protein n=1 Tax=Rossellomorea marisflavi TaxID=189381 RepID=UPI0027A8CECD|nr:peptidase G2 autoproteolytic cleavage domain-containing protein [Rossellomorea marisflavi]UTE72778.1 hypothetical protein M1I95_21470 [Rossellomorea marisflavi]